MSTEYRYTDRDVRENPYLTTLAYDYLQHYGGDFEPLISALGTFKNEGTLPTNLIRVVLNCMRHDANVANKLPAPIGYVVPRKIAEVVKPRKRDWREPVPCELSEAGESHEGHTYRLDDDLVICEGLPYKINRDTFYHREATVKVPFARARGGRFVHSLTGEAWLEWRTPNLGHSFGWGKYPPILTVKTSCKYPSWLNKPILLTADKARVILESVPDELSVCPYCTEVAIKNAAHRQEDPLSLLCEERDDSFHRDVQDPPCEGADVSESA